MNDPFPAIAEADASGLTAELFADIRATVGVRVVNLVWRHLATLDGALPWAWATVKPLYMHGLADGEVRRFRKQMALPELGGLDGEVPPSVDAVLASYDHSNTVNLFTLGALLARLRGEVAAGPDSPVAGRRIPAPDVELPRLASQADVVAETWERVLRLNRFGDSPEPIILASMYRHLAHAPGFLSQLEPALARVEADGSLRRCIDGNRRLAAERSAVLARAIEASPPPASAPAIERGVAAFVDHAIGKMVTICRAIRVARGTSRES